MSQNLVQLDRLCQNSIFDLVKFRTFLVKGRSVYQLEMPFVDHVFAYGRNS